MAAASSSSSAAASMGLDFEHENVPHVLAVDDSFVDRKIIEKLLIKSACKGKLLSSALS